MHRVLERDGLAPYLDAVVISADLGRRKPVPAVFRSALEQLGAAAETTLFVGDDPQDDIEGAKAVGMRTAWVRPGTEAALDGGHRAGPGPRRRHHGGPGDRAPPGARGLSGLGRGR